MFTITIDDKKVQVPSGTTILQAARKLDVDIPTFCDHKDLLPYGSCRMCVVEVEGSDRLFASCVVPVTDGMEIHTNTARVQRARQAVLELRRHLARHRRPPARQVLGAEARLEHARDRPVEQAAARHVRHRREAVRHGAHVEARREPGHDAARRHRRRRRYY